MSEDGMVSVPLSWSERHADVKAERDRLQAEKDHLVEVNAALRTRPDLAERAPLVVALVEERDRYRAVVGAAREFVGAQRAWIERAKKGDGVRSSDEETRRRAAAVATLGMHVDQLDAEEGT